MKVYTKVVIKIEDSEVIASDSHDYEGPVALAGGGGSAAQPKQPIAGQIVRDLWFGGDRVPNSPLANRLQSIVQPNANDPYRDLAVNHLTNDINGQYGARGLATSGIGMKGVTEAITNFDVNREEQKSNQAVQMLGTAGSGPTAIPGRQPSGLFGLK